MMNAPAAALGDGADVADKPKGKGKLILLAVPVLLIGLGAGGWFSGILPNLLGFNKAAAGAEEKGAGATPGGKEAGKDSGKESGKDSGKEAGKEAGKDAGKDGGKGSTEKLPGLVFLDIPEIVANLNVGGRRASFIKLKAKLELTRTEDVVAATAAMPRLLDLFQTYLRDMRPEELRGSTGSYRLREALLARAGIAVAPVRITDVLFTELLVQ